MVILPTNKLANQSDWDAHGMPLGRVFQYDTNCHESLARVQQLLTYFRINITTIWTTQLSYATGLWVEYRNSATNFILAAPAHILPWQFMPKAQLQRQIDLTNSTTHVPVIGFLKLISIR